MDATFEVIKTQDDVKNEEPIVSFEGSTCKKENKRDLDTMIEHLNEDTITDVSNKHYKARPSIVVYNVSNNKMIVDTETNGLGFKTDVLQIAWIVINDKHEILTRGNMLIKNRKNRPAAFLINKISDEDLEKKGVLFYDVISQFIDDLNMCDTVIGHNVQFDIKAICNDITKSGISICDPDGNKIDNIFEGKKIECTMKMYKKFLEPIEKKRQTNGQEPLSKKLCEMYKYFFGTDFDNAHDAMADVMATFECYDVLVCH